LYHTKPPRQPFPYTTLFRSITRRATRAAVDPRRRASHRAATRPRLHDREADGLQVKGRGDRSGHKHVRRARTRATANMFMTTTRSEEHTSELQSRGHLVCRL